MKSRETQEKRHTPLPFLHEGPGPRPTASWTRIIEGGMIAVAGPVLIMLAGYFLALPALELKLGVAVEQINENETTGKSNSDKLSRHELVIESHPTILQSMEWQKQAITGAMQASADRHEQQQGQIQAMSDDIDQVGDNVRELQRTVERVSRVNGG